MAIGDRYQLIDTQTLFGQAVLNVYYYKQTAGAGGSAEEVAALWDGQVMPAIQAIQNIAVARVVLAVVNLDDVTDFFLLPTVGEGGGITGDSLPPFVCWAFRYNRTSRAVRNGQKRIAGVPENMVYDGVVNPTSEATVAATADALSVNLDFGVSQVYEPVIMRKEYDPVTGITTYTDFPTSGAVYVRISSQNTRKFGRGA